MEIYNHIAININGRPIVWKYIRESGLKYECVYDLCVLDISESDPRWEKLSEILKQENTAYLSETKYEDRELLSAEWLTVRSKWYYDYPQPEDKYEQITYTKENLCSHRDCGMELIQKDCFRFKRTPKWGRRNFCMTNWVYDELFVSTKAKELIENSDLTGFVFSEVKNKSGKEALNDIYQMKFPYVLDDGIADFSIYIRGVFVCPTCGKQKIRPNGKEQHVFKKEVFSNAPDFVKSSEWFGAAASASRLILVSQKAYRFIVENKLDSSLVFEPIVIV